MAIQTNKFLPSAKSDSSSAIVKKNISIPNINLLKPVEKDIESSSDLTIIKTKVVEIDKLLKNNLILRKEQDKVKRKEEEKEKFEKKEKELESKKSEVEIKPPKLNIPGMGILDAVKRFLFFTALGRLFELTKQFGSQLGEFIQKIAPIADFIEGFIGNLFKGVVDFIDFGYKAYDTVRNFTKQLGGESFQKTFDEFSKNLNTFINLAIIAGLAATGGTDFKRKGGTPKGSPKGGSIKPTTTPRKPTGYRPPEGVSRYLREDRVAQYGTRTKGFGEKLSQRTRITQQRLIQRPLRNITRPARQFTSKIIGKTGAKIAGKVFGKIPIIGGLVDFLFALWSGEPVGRAAAKAVGATIGSALGTFIPIPIAGTILGGILGDIVGGALYDTLVGNQPPKPKKKMSTGGRVSTQTSQKTNPPIRRKIKSRQIVKQIQPQISKPGQDVGGENKIKKIFADPMRPIDPNVKPNPDVVNPLGTLKEVSKILKEIPFLGGIMGSSVDLAMGQRPDRSLLFGFGDAIGTIIQGAVDNKVGQSIDEIIKSTLVMAEGGEVVSRSIGTGENTGKIIGMKIAKLLESSISSRINSVFNKIIEQFEKKPLSGESGVPGPPPEDDDLLIAGGSEDFWTLVAVASREDASPQGSADVAQSIYNRLASGAYTGRTIRQLILANNQYQPTWDYPQRGTSGVSNPEWRSIKDADSAASAAGMSVAAIKNVAKNILNPTLQKSAREFVQGRTDFKAQGQGVTGISRDGRSNVFGWHYNYRENKVASVPSFGATVVSKPGGGFDIKMETLGREKGNLQQAKLIAQKLGVPLYSYVRPGDPGYHGQGRAMDFSNDAVGKGTPEQMKLAKELVKRYGATAKEIFYTPLGFSIKDGKKVSPIDASNHYHHVHVAFQGGGLISPNQQKRDMSSLKTRASYESTGQTIYLKTLIVEKPVPIPTGSGLSGLSIPTSP